MQIESQIMSDLMIESSIDAMIAVGSDEVIIAWNSAAKTLFDQPQAAVLGTTLSSAIPSYNEDANLQAAIKRARQGQKSFLGATSDFKHRTHVETHVLPLNRGTAGVGVMLLIHDVSHRIAKEVELQRLNRELRSRLRQLHLRTGELTQLTSITGHNVRKPIREIYLAVEHLIRAEAGTMSSKGRASFRRIQSSLTRISLLLDDIITLNQIDIADPPTIQVDLANLFAEVQKEFSQRLQHANASLILVDSCHPVAHKDQLHLLLQQLLSNLIKFANHPSPQVTLSCFEGSHADKQDEQEKPFWILAIKHNSAAFSEIMPNLTMHISEDIDIRQYTGPAIAMLIATRIMEVHSGFIEVSDHEDGQQVINCFFPRDPGNL
jgi:PAS domain S-box-containing protein